MSEDEILKDIDNYISFANKAENFSDINEYLHCKELARRMKGLLDLYNKEKEKNKELDKKFRYAVPDDMIHKLYVEKELYEQEKEKSKKCEYYEMVADELYKNSIGKDKIKEKIKQLDEVGTKLYWYEEIVEMLKDLLEE